MKVTVLPSEQKKIQVPQRYFRVLSASGSFTITDSDSGRSTVKSKQTVDLQGVSSVLIENLTGTAVDIEYEVSAHRIYDTDEFLIADGSQVGITPGSTIDIGEVTMAADAEISIKAGSDVAVNNFPANQTVSGTVGVNNFPATQTVDGAVSVDALPAVTVAADQKIKKDASGSYVGLAPLTFVEAGAKTIAANAGRKEIHLKAALGNNGKIWVGSTDGTTGIPLGLGEGEVFEVTAAHNVYGDNAGDVLYISEVLE